MKKYSKRELSLPILLLIGSGSMIGAVAVSALVFAIISSLTPDPASLTGIFSLVSLLIAGAVASFVISKLIPDGGILIAIISAAIAALVMSAVGLIIKGGAVPFGIFLNYLAFIATSALFAFLATKTGGTRRRYR